VILTSYALALGFFHGLGADHLMAIATLSVRPPGDGERRTHPVRVAVGFALGHALLLLLGSAAVVLLGWQIPALIERTGEVVGGILLIALGAFSLWVAFSRRLYGHSHTHGHPPHTHWHLHLGPPSRHGSGSHSHVPGILGAVFAVSGLRALVMMAPFGGSEATPGVAASIVTLLFLTAVFAVGIVISMSLFGVVLSRVLGSAWLVRHVGRGAAILTALASMALGIYWIARTG
jgi:nickel/cobalt transporter (NicO) family protein